MEPLRRLAIGLGSRPQLPRLGPGIVAIDRALDTLSGGRAGLVSAGGLPALTLTVVGRRTGTPRRTPLLGIPHEGGWLVVGSNWGGHATPAWVGNLEAAGRAVVTARGRDVPVVAERLTGVERDRLWDVAVATWPNFAVYAARTQRRIPVFRLTPAGPATRHRRRGSRP